MAGTNGKGSVCAMLERVLLEAGMRTGLYTSPHLTDVRDRIRVGGRPIPRRAFARLLERSLAAERGGRERLTYFELLTSVAFEYFKSKRVEIAVLETGLGGRLDATNVVRSPLACVITSVGIDHTSYLGRTLGRIAAEKAGILKPGSPILVPDLAPDAMEVVRRKARSLGAPLHVVRPWKTLKTDWAGNSQVVGGRGRSYELGLLGGSQPANAALAHAALRQVAGLDLKRNFDFDKVFARGLRKTSLPGRFEVRRIGRRLAVIDGAHNAEAMASLRNTLGAAGWLSAPIRFIIGVLRDKDAVSMLKALGPGLKDVVTVAPPSPRAVPPGVLAACVRSLAPGARVGTAGGVGEALEAWLRAPGAPRRAVVCGSFYLVGPAVKTLDRHG